MDEKLFEDIEMAKYYQRYRPDYRRPDIEEKVIPFLREQLPQTPDSIAVDVACGTGQLTRLLASSFKKVIGVDVSEAQIAVAKEFTPDENIEYRISTAEKLPFVSSESVDLVSVAVAIQYFDTELFFKEIDRILKPGGCLMVISICRPSSYYSVIPDSTNVETISQCRSLMDEVAKCTLQNIGSKAGKICTTGQYSTPPYQENYKFMMKLWKPLNGLEEFGGFLNTLAGLRKYRKDNPDEDDVMKVMQKRLETILCEITPTPETFQLYFNGELECALYRKPCQH